MIRLTLLRCMMSCTFQCPPFNLLPPQLLVLNLKKINYEVEWFKHDDWRYVLQYSASGDKNKLTIPIDNRNMFTLWTQFGYYAFTCRQYNDTAMWNGFSGSNLIMDDTPLPSSTPNSNPREPEIYEEQRERNATIDDNLRDPTTI